MSTALALLSFAPAATILCLLMQERYRLASLIQPVLVVISEFIGPL